MPSDYERICQDNIHRRGEEFDDIGRLISEQLYSDRTHFIYELLQNAEDALDRRKKNNPENKLPTNVKFLLYKNHLEFRHFGEKFNTNDVKGISDVLKGTKSEDKTQIGKFGIGFKSVYAFTSTPEIHSGDEHFIIERYIRPRSADRFPKMADGETVFVFPFNHKDLSKEQAFQLIEKKLKKIGLRVLLFLKHISEIEWKIEGQDEGQYLKESKQRGRLAQKVTVIGQHGNEDEEEEWLVFRRHLDDASSSCESFVEVAFRLKDDGKSKKQIIQKTESSPLVVYFPTKLETRFGFLVQGPYDTTASRSDIEDNEWNKKLIEETTFLITEQVLPILKEMGLFTVSLLEALPIRMNDFPEDGMFYPIVEAVRDALIDQELLPADDGTFVSARNAKLASAEWLRTLLRDEQMMQLFKTENPLKWISGEITERAKHDLWKYIREELKVEEITPDSFARKIEGSFLEKQTDDWMIAFYSQLVGQKALWKKGSNSYWDKAGPLRAKQFIRLQDGSHHVRPFKDDGSPNARWAVEEDTDTSLPIVKIVLSQNKDVLHFLRELKIPELDIVEEVIEKVLQKYPSPVSIDEHQRDIKKILRSYKTDSQEKKRRLIERLQATSFILTKTPGIETISFRRPIEAYFWSDELGAYFSGSDTVGFVRSDYYDQSALALFEDLGVTDEIRIRCKSKNGSAEYVKLEYKNGYRRGLKGFDPDIHVDGLEDAIRNPSTEGKKFIWNKIGVKYSHCIKGKVLRSSRQDFSPNASTYEEDEITSNFGHLLIDKAWLLSPDGNFVRPSELSLADLPIEFEKDTPRAKSLSLAMRMKQSEHEQALEVVTEGNPDLKMLIEHFQSASDAERKKILKSIPSEHPPEPAPSFKDGLKKLGRRQRGTTQHGGTEGSPVSDTNRYQDKLIEDVEQEVAKYQSTSQIISFSPVRDRSMNAGARDFLYEQYHGRCQVTGTTFPKASRNINGVSKNYFESCALLSYTNAEYLNDAGNMLCVSADTMAKLKCASIDFLDSLEDTIESFKLNSGQLDKVSVRIRLAGEECSIKWTQRHFMRLIALYEKA